MDTAQQRAAYFVEREREFHLGSLVTEQSHPLTANLSDVIQADVAAGVRLLLEVDSSVLPAMERALASPEFDALVGALRKALSAGRRVCFTGCGATGRLAILLEASWRRFWRALRQRWAHLADRLPDLEDSAFSVMAGGDFALIKSVEGFEDYTLFGEYQLAQGGVAAGDVVVAITEGGETSFVIGTAWRGLAAGARVFFVYNNPTDLLRQRVARSREVIDDRRIVKLDLAAGPMAIAGSTRMQATTCELLVIGAALETALVQILSSHLAPGELTELGLASRSPAAYSSLFANLVGDLCEPSAIDALARATEFEADLYRGKGLVTYMADAFLLDILTDTTERAPTFSLPSFVKIDDRVSPPSWAFCQNPLWPTPQAWQEMLQRPPRGLDWDLDTYRRLKAPAVLQDNPPRLDNDEIYRFAIGREPDQRRWQTPQAALIMVLVGREAVDLPAPGHPFQIGFARHAAHYTKTAAMCVGPHRSQAGVDALFDVPCALPASPLSLWGHLAVKLALNTLSTATMAMLGRVVGNWMVHVQASNKKLVDRSTRLIAGLTGLSYAEACVALYEAIDEIARMDPDRERPSPAALAIERVGRKGGH